MTVPAEAPERLRALTQAQAETNGTARNDSLLRRADDQVPPTQRMPPA